MREGQNKLIKYSHLSVAKITRGEEGVSIERKGVEKWKRRKENQRENRTRQGRLVNDDDRGGDAFLRGARKSNKYVGGSFCLSGPDKSAADQRSLSRKVSNLRSKYAENSRRENTVDFIRLREVENFAPEIRKFLYFSLTNVKSVPTEYSFVSNDYPTDNSEITLPPRVFYYLFSITGSVGEISIEIKTK